MRIINGIKPRIQHLKHRDVVVRMQDGSRCSAEWTSLTQHYRVLTDITVHTLTSWGETGLVTLKLSSTSGMPTYMFRYLEVKDDTLEFTEAVLFVKT